MRLRDSIWIRTSPELVFEFFEAMDANYLRWHPDHLLFRWEQGRGVKPGVVFYFEETIGGTRMKKRVHFTRVEPNRHVEFTFTNPLLALIVPRLSFHFEPEGGGTRFDAEIQIRTGPIGAWLNRREFDAVRRHMREEGENLKSLLENPAAEARFGRT
jgi:uncharacterized protein YndB with AHSA1/START domain